MITSTSVHIRLPIAVGNPKSCFVTVPVAAIMLTTMVAVKKVTTTSTIFRRGGQSNGTRMDS